MNNPYHFDDMLQLVRQTLVEVFGCPLDELKPQCAIANDLGGDSLDFVELRFVLEKKLSMMLPQTSVLDAFEEHVDGSPAMVERGGITEFAVQVLQRSLFRYSEQTARAGMQPYDLFAATTVREWANLCLHMFDFLPDACPECGHGEAVVSSSGKAACASCGANVKPAAGDVAMTRSVVAIGASLEQMA
jgi:acyl carrier protein